MLKLSVPTLSYITSTNILCANQPKKCGTYCEPDDNKKKVLGKNYCTLIILYFSNLILSQVKLIVCTQIAFYFLNLLLSFLLVCAFVFIFTSTEKVISKHQPINIDSQPGIEIGTLQFQDNHEMPYTTEATSPSNISVCYKFYYYYLLLDIIYMLIIITIVAEIIKVP